MADDIKIDVTGGGNQIAPNATTTIICNNYGNDAVRIANSTTANRTVLQGVVMSPYQYSATRPEQVDNEYIRKGQLEYFEKWLTNDHFLCIYGDKGVGITTLLSQFAHMHEMHCVSYFFNDMETWRLDATTFESELVRQLLCYIGMPPTDGFDRLDLSAIMQRVSQKMHADKSHTLYFVIDNIDAIPSECVDSIKDVLNKLPKMQAKFIFSGRKEDVLKLLPPKTEKQLGCCEHEIINMSEAEVKEYFLTESPDLTTEHLQALWDITRGNARKMNILLTRYIRLEKLSKLLTGEITDTSDLYTDDFENAYQQADETTRHFVEILTYVSFAMPVELVSAVLKVDEQQVKDIARRLNDMLYCADDSTYRIRSDSFKEYLREKLKARKQTVERELLKVMRESGDSLLYSSNILQLMKSLGMSGDIATYLSSENIHAIFIDHQTQASLNELCNCGFEACQANPDKYFTPLFRFVVTKAVSREIERNELWDNEIDAIMALGHHEQAFALANKVYLNEERLKAYLSIAKYKKQLSEQDYAILNDYIKALVKIIEFEKIPQKAIELATMLLPVDYESAVGIIDRIADAYKDRVNTDRMYTLLSMCTIETDGETPSKDLVDAKIQDEGMRSLAHAARNLFSEDKIETVLNEIDQMTNDRLKLHLLSIWIPEHKDKEGIGKMILKAVQLIVAISDTDIPKAKTLAKVCCGMGKMTREEMVHALEYINAVDESIQCPTFDYVDAKLEVIEGTHDVMPDESRAQLKRLRQFIDDITDPAVHMACLAKLLGHKAVSSSEDDCNRLRMMAKEVMSKTSLHYKVLEEPVRALSATHTSLVCELIDAINTHDRQMEAYSLAAGSYLLNQDESDIKPDTFFTLLGKTDMHRSHREKPLRLLTKILVHSKDVDHNAFLASIKKNIHFFEEVEDPHTRILLLAHLYRWMKKQHLDDSFADFLKKQILSLWRNLESEKERTVSGYLLVQYFAKTDKDEAENILNETGELRNRSYLATSSSDTAFTLTLSLYITSMCLMVRNGLCNYKDKYYKQFETIIDNNLSNAEAIEAWNAIAMEFHFRDNGNGGKDFNAIWNSKLTVNFQSFAPYVRKTLLQTLAPAMFFQNSELLFEHLKEYDAYFQDGCLSDVADAVITNAFQQSTSNAMVYDMDFANLQRLATIIGHFNSDESIFHYVKIITRSISKGKREKPLSKDQLNALLNTLDNIVESKLPAPGGISHDGYKVSCKADIMKVKSEISNPADCQVLADMVERIDNVSDRAFLYFDLAPLLPRSQDKKNFFEKGIATANGIASSYEKTTRFDMIISECKENNLTDMVRPVAMKAMECLRSNGTEKDYKQLLDAVYQQKPELADELIKEIDKDPARRLYKSRLQKHLESSKRIDEANKETDAVAKLRRDEQAQYFSNRLNTLRDGTGQLLKAGEVMKMTMNHIFDNSLSDAQYAIMYVMEDIFRKDGKNYQAMQRAIHEILTQALNVAMTVSAGTKENITRIGAFMHIADPSSEMGQVGDTEEAWARIFEWFKANIKTQLYIIDSYFHPSDLRYVKELCDIDDTVEIRILANKEKDAIEEYESEWHRISSGVTNDIRLNLVYYTEQSKGGPLLDRYIVSYDSDTREMCGLKLSSLSTIGSKESSIIEISPELARDIRDSYVRYALEKPKRIKGRGLSYEELRLE